MLAIVIAFKFLATMLLFDRINRKDKKISQNKNYFNSEIKPFNFGKEETVSSSSKIALFKIMP